MGDIITSVSTAITITKRLMEINDKIKDAEIKNLLADLNLELAETKNKLSEIIIENTDLKQHVYTLENDLKTKNELIQYRGSGFKRKPSGGFEETVYCTSCKSGMYADDPEDPFLCSKCNIFSSFNSGELKQILSEVIEEYG